MSLETIDELKDEILAETPELEADALRIATALKESRTAWDEIADACAMQDTFIDLDEDEQMELMGKISTLDPSMPGAKHARLTQLIFQLNYYAMTFTKAADMGFLDCDLKETAREYGVLNKELANIVEDQFI